MGSKNLANRRKWQGRAGVGGRRAENAFRRIFSAYLKLPYELVQKPKDLRGVYQTKHGIEPDFSILNKDTGKKIFVELKWQKAAGNAHERACKYFAPGLVVAGRKIGKISDTQFPFWLIFSGGMAKDNKYRREINFWFKDIEDNLFLWKNLHKKEEICEHFEQYIKPILEK